ncbi:MAG TPA: hypothetical protein DCM87_18225 [Planctomycetes bacterium]|nr:hypothetical protein [Planctomycetota bacterium]
MAACAFAATELYGAAAGQEPAGRVYQGDNLAVLEALAGGPAGAIDFIYIDPPFCTGNQYRVLRIAADEGGRQELDCPDAYTDRFEGGIDGYIEFLEPRIARMRDLLAPSGSFVIHIDWRAASHVRLLLDRIFGPDRLVNELVWFKGFRGTRIRRAFQHSHDTLWWYAKGGDYFWSQGCEAYRDESMSRYNKIDEEGRRYALIKRRRGDGTIYYGKTYPQGKWRNDVLADIPTMAATAPERTGYPTQKPRKLLDVLIESLCPPGGLVADFFCGAGTTLAAAAAGGRRFIGADLSPVALNFTRKRLATASPAAPFAVMRPAGAAPRACADGAVARTPAGTLRRTGPAGEALDFWAAGPAAPDGVFRPGWCAAAGGKTALPVESPPLGASGAIMVLLAGPDGREVWSQV